MKHSDPQNAQIQTFIFVKKKKTKLMIKVINVRQIISPKLYIFLKPRNFIRLVVFFVNYVI